MIDMDHGATASEAALIGHPGIASAFAVQISQFPADATSGSLHPIRPMSGRDRADLRSSGGGESCDLCRARISKHGQPGRSRVHGSDAGGNPTKSGAPVKRVEGPHFHARSVLA